jgi:hypothetical protein
VCALQAGIRSAIPLTSNDLFTLPLALLNMEYGSVGQVNFGYRRRGR